MYLYCVREEIVPSTSYNGYIHYLIFQLKINILLEKMFKKTVKTVIILLIKCVSNI